MIPVAGWVALVAGAVFFFSPCMWPMYPAYLTYLAGSPPAAGTRWAASDRRLLLVRAALFLVGVGLVFMALGATASAVGQVLSTYQVAFRKVSGLLIIGFGLAMAGVLPAWLLGGSAASPTSLRSRAGSAPSPWARPSPSAGPRAWARCWRPFCS